MNMYSFAFGIGTKNSKQDWLEVYFPEPLLNPDSQLIKQIADLVGYGGGNTNIDLDDDQIQALIKGIDEPRQCSILSAIRFK